MVMIGATLSRLAIKIPIHDMKVVSSKAVVGSPVADPLAKIDKNGMSPSLAMAWRRRGAPVKLCSPAPTVDRNEPISTTHSVGKAISAANRPPSILSPNLRERRPKKENGCIAREDPGSNLY